MSKHKVGISAENSEDVEDEITQEQVNGASLNVKGMALPFEEVSRNGVQYSKKSVEEAADTLEGQPVLFNHNEDKPPVGHVESVRVEEDGLYYKIDLDNKDERTRKVERGDISSVSIQAFVERREGDTPIVDVKEFLELSLVAVPGFKQTTTRVEAMEAAEGVITMETFKEEFIDEDGLGKKYEEALEGTVDEAKDSFDEMDDANFEAAYVTEIHGKDRKTMKQYLREQMDSGTEKDKNDEKETNTMEDETTVSEQFSDLDERDMYDFIASHFGDLEVDEVSQLYEDYEFGGFDKEEVASLVAKGLGVETEDVASMFDDMMEDDSEEPEEEPEEPEDDMDDGEDGEEEGDYEDDDEEQEADDEDEDEEDDKKESMDRSDLIERVEALEEKLEAEDAEDEESKEESEEESVEEADGGDEEDDEVEESASSLQKKQSSKSSNSFKGNLPRIGG